MWWKPSIIAPYSKKVFERHKSKNGMTPDMRTCAAMFCMCAQMLCTKDQLCTNIIKTENSLHPQCYALLSGRIWVPNITDFRHADTAEGKWVMMSGLSRKMSRLDLFSWRFPCTVKQLGIIKPLFNTQPLACGETCIRWQYTEILFLHSVCSPVYVCPWWTDPPECGFTVMAHTAVIFSTGSPGQCGLVDVHLLERHSNHLVTPFPHDTLMTDYISTLNERKSVFIL